MSNEHASDVHEPIRIGRIKANFESFDDVAKRQLKVAFFIETCKGLGKTVLEKFALPPELFETDEKDLQE